MKKTALVLAALWMGGCVSDGPGLSANAGAPPAAAPGQSAKVSGDPDKPRQLCVDTSEGINAKQVCY